MVDNQYHVLGLIGWEYAFAGPWEIFGDFPLTLSTVPPAINAPWNYDGGRPKDVVMSICDKQHLHHS